MPLNLAEIRAVALDLDGVVWRGAETLPGVPDFFDFLTARGIPYLFLSNNSTRTITDYVEKIGALRIAVRPDQIISSPVVTLAELRHRHPEGTPIYVIGSDALKATLTAAGYYLDPDNAAVVISGLDVHLTYEKLTIAGQRIMAGAAFIGTNADRSLPVSGGKFWPGAGSILAALETMTGVRARVMGKPEAAMFMMALERFGVPAAHTLMIGDRLDTDILGAARAGMRTALVETGVSEGDDQADVQPDQIFGSLADVLRAWQAM